MAKIGKKLLQMLMFALYPEPQTIYREYLQNSSDSIKEAVREGILEKGEGHITINIDPYKQQIQIKDNGIGIPSNKAEETLKNIAMSSKQDKEYVAGFYGIGRLVGAGYCEELVFKTKYKGEKVVSEFKFDVNKISELINSTGDDLEASDVIDEATSFSATEKAEKDDHYFLVILNNVKPEYGDLLDEDAIAEYLYQVAPIEYSLPFNGSLFTPCLQEADSEIQKYAEDLNKVSITLNNNVDIRKKYGLKIDGTDEKISKVRFFPIHNDNNELLAWGWYAITGFERQIPDFDKNQNVVLTRGMRLRIHNIQIGDSSFFDGQNYFKQARSNKYFNGEIHVVNTNIKPTTDRSDLAPSKEALDLKKKLRDFFNGEMQSIYQNANKTKNILKGYIEAVKEKEEAEKQPVSSEYTKEQKKEAINKAQAKIDRVSVDVQKNILDKPSKNDGEKAMMDIYKYKYDSIQSNINSGKSVLTDTNTKKETKQPKVATNFLEQSRQELEAKYSKEQMEMIEKIYNIIDTHYYQESYERLIKPLKALLINELKK